MRAEDAEKLDMDMESLLYGDLDLEFKRTDNSQAKQNL